MSANGIEGSFETHAQNPAFKSQDLSQISVKGKTFSNFLQALTFAGFLVHLQAVSSGTGAVETDLQIVAVVRTAAVVELALVNICGNADTDDSGF